MTPWMTRRAGRDSGADLQAVALRVEEGPQQRGEGDADRVVATEQGDGDAGEAEPGLERRAVDCRSCPKSSGMPTSPASAPEMIIDMRTMRLHLDAARDGRHSERPVARRSKPNRVLLMTNQ